MNNKQRRSYTVGIFVILGIFLFTIAIYLVGKKENVFGSPVKVSAIFKDVKGLRAGDNVRLSGIDIGTVSSLAFMKDNRVFVLMNIEQEQAEFVKKDSKVTIASEGLMGSKVVMLLPGNPDTEAIGIYDTLLTVEQIDINDILKEVNKSSKNISIVSDELVSITKKINRGDGVFGKIFTDTTLTRNLDAATRNIAYITDNLYELTDKVNQGEGIIGKIFADTTLSAGLGTAGMNINEIASNLAEVTDKINRGEGIFGRMFTDTSLTNNIYLTSKNLRTTSASLSGLAEKLNNDSSALNMLIDDPNFADSLEVLLDRLNVSVVEVTEAADAVQRSGLIRLFSKKKKD